MSTDALGKREPFDLSNYGKNHLKKTIVKNKKNKKYRLDAGVMNNDNIFITACKKKTAS
jgi:hypothetical protein